MGCESGGVLRLHIKLIFGKDLKSIQFHLLKVEGLKLKFYSQISLRRICCFAQFDLIGVLVKCILKYL